MRKLILAASLLCVAPVTAAVTVTALPASPFVEDHTDLFDVAQGTTVTGSTGGYSGFYGEDAFGAVHANSLEPGHFVFNDFIYPWQSQYLSFQSAAPISISGFNLYLGSDTSGLREFDTIELIASLDNVTFVSLASATIAGPTYLTAYGSTAIRVQATFADGTYQYFRLNAHDRAGFVGGRILEFDAIAGGVSAGAIPEPLTWATMLLGFGLVGSAMRRMTRRPAALV